MNNETPNPIHTFLDAPHEIAISELAQPEFDRYCAGGDEQLAMSQIAELHMANVRQTARYAPRDSVGGIFVTDLEGVDLAVVDVMLPFIADGKRHAILMTQKQAQEALIRFVNDMATLNRQYGNRKH